MIEILVEDPAWMQALPDADGLAAAAAAAALLNASSVLEDRPDPPPALRRGESGLAVLLTSDEAVQDLNARFRGKDKPTNVLSFPAPANPESHLGDVALAYGVCSREAAEQGKALGRHLQHLVVHGVLHLLGYDHMSDDEAEAMEGLERIVLAGLGAPDPYQADGRDHD